MPKTKKQRVHNEWFRTVSLGNRKSCPTCGDKLHPSESIWSWGEYQYGKWRTVKHFCKSCFSSEVQAPLLAHVEDCGCAVELRCKDPRPDWLSVLVRDESPTSCDTGESGRESA